MHENPSLHLSSSSDEWFEKLSQRDRRVIIFNIMYACEAHDYQLDVSTLVHMFNRDFDTDIPLHHPMIKNLQAIIDMRNDLDALYKPLLNNWKLDRLSVSTKLVLRYACWELLHTNTDALVVINEAIEMAKCFAEHDAYKFINGILDEILKQQLIVRPPVDA